jgi:hypothetical protein
MGDGTIALGLISIVVVGYFVLAGREEKARAAAPKPKTFWEKMLNDATPRDRSMICKHFGDELAGCR